MIMFATDPGAVAREYFPIPKITRPWSHKLAPDIPTYKDDKDRPIYDKDHLDMSNDNRPATRLDGADWPFTASGDNANNHQRPVFDGDKRDSLAKPAPSNGSEVRPNERVVDLPGGIPGSVGAPAAPRDRR